MSYWLAWKLTVQLNQWQNYMTDIVRNIKSQLLEAGKSCLSINFNYFNQFMSFSTYTITPVDDKLELLWNLHRMLYNMKKIPENLWGALAQENTETHLLITVVNDWGKSNLPKKERKKIVKEGKTLSCDYLIFLKAEHKQLIKSKLIIMKYFIN